MPLALVLRTHLGGSCGHTGYVAACPHPVPDAWVQVPAQLRLQLPVTVLALTAQVLGSLLPTWETQGEVRLSWLWPGPPQGVAGLMGNGQWLGELCFCLSLKTGTCPGSCSGQSQTPRPAATAWLLPVALYGRTDGSSSPRQHPWLPCLQALLAWHMLFPLHRTPFPLNQSSRVFVEWA